MRTPARSRPIPRLLAFTLFLALLSSVLPCLWPGEAFAIPAWSRKYEVECQMCHSPVYPRLNRYGERFQANGYQDPDEAVADGDKQGKSVYNDQLSLDTNPGHWFTARLNLTPIQYETNTRTVDGEVKDRLTIGNSNWLQLFVAGSITKNTSVYIENEFASDGFHQAWYYLGLHNLGSSWANLQVGRLSAVVFAPYPDRLPQLPVIGKGIMRVKSSDGKGVSSLDLRSPRFGIQYYGYQGPVTLYGGVTPGPQSSNAANEVGYWAGIRLFAPESGPRNFLDSSIGLHFDAGTDAAKGADTLKVENTYWRIMPGINLRFKNNTDIQAVYVFAKDDNWNLSATAPQENKYQGVRAVGSHILNEHWAVSAHYDLVTADDESLLPDQNMLFVPVVTYLWRQNFRVSLYPGIDLRDVDSDAKNHVLILNIRTAI